MPLALRVIIRQHHHMAALQSAVILRGPFTRSHRAGRSHQPLLHQPVSVFFALGNENWFLGGSQYLWEMVDHPTHTLNIPNPPALTVWLALAEVLGIVFHRLKQQLSTSST
jgi:hypothetical protein